MFPEQNSSTYSARVDGLILAHDNNFHFILANKVITTVGEIRYGRLKSTLLGVVKGVSSA